MIADHSFRVPPIIRAGAGAAEHLAEDVARLGVRRALVVSDRIIAELPEVVSLRHALENAGVATFWYTDLRGEPTFADVDAALAASREASADGVIGIGGGSALDTAKMVAVLATNGGSATDYEGVDKIRAPRLPLALAATTAGTGSEVTRYAVISRSSRVGDDEVSVKMLVTSWQLLPDVAIADPLLTMGSPPSVTAASGIDALTHAIEAYVSRRANPTSDLFALSGVRQIFPNLYAAWARGADRNAREAIMLGAHHAGIAFSNASVALVHGMSRPIGAYFHVPHGISNAMLLPAVLRFSRPAAIERYRDVAIAMGVARPGDHAELASQAAVDGVVGLCARLGVPSLVGWGIDRSRLLGLASRMASDALASGSPSNNPRVPTADEIVALYERSL